ncbi:hypothetical protein CL617_03095 [archaeon]|nr:hypothetical protein [archaeon]|tara:strand:- start:24206 stop:26071 length:1866 start_codon:yes stop_codon:yes gene_type:complete
MLKKEEIFFPYDNIRPNQDSLISGILGSFDNKKSVLTHAPTGLGKTVSILSPLMSKVKDKDVTIFFLTPKHSQHKIVIETLRLIKNKFNVKITAVDFVGKKLMCAQSNIDNLYGNQFYDYCKDVRENKTCDYYNNFKEKTNRIKKELLSEKLVNLNLLNVEDLAVISKNEKICPYEISSDIGKKAKVIIADYNHLLNPGVREHFLERVNKTLSNSILVFDEAHNLVDKCRDLLSVKLSSLNIEYAYNEAKRYGYEELANEIKKLEDIFNSLGRELPINEYESLIKKEQFYDEIDNYDELIVNLKLAVDDILEKKKKSFLFSIANFLEYWQGEDDGYVRVIKKEFYRNKPNLVLSYSCLDPSLITKSLIEESFMLILMSGTLNPLNMYKDLLGFKDNVELLEYENQFPKENRLNLIVPRVSTKFTLRSSEMFKKIAGECANIVNNVPGNTILFFPSYFMRDSVYDAFSLLSKKTVFREEKNMNKKERNELLEKFKEYKDSGAVLMGVSAGSFGEGVDFPGDLLKCVVVVGLPFAKPDLETKELISYYDRLYGDGWNYGYIYPAIIKTLQNAGRCIRSEEDRGVIIFLDDRYLSSQYRRCFPKDMNLQISNDPQDLIKEFFTN